MRIRKFDFRRVRSFPLSNGLYAIFSFSWFKNSSSNGRRIDDFSDRDLDLKRKWTTSSFTRETVFERTNRIFRKCVENVTLHAIRSKYVFLFLFLFYSNPPRI